MASSTILCLLCKDEGCEETPFLALAPDCICCNETKRIHIRCAKLYTKLHTSQIKKYCPDYVMCRVCTKNINGPQSYTVNSNKKTVDNCTVETYQYWQPSEESRSEAMRQSGHYLNIGLKYPNSNRTSTIEVWYFPLGSQFTKPLLMKQYGFNEYGSKHGSSIQYYSNGKLQSTGNWRNGNKNGEFKEYRISGQLQSIKHYSNDRLHGEVIIYDETGTIIEQSNYHEGTLNGHSIAWYSKDKKKHDWHYTGAGLTNLSKNSYSWYDNGNINKQYICTGEKHTNGKDIIRRSEFYANGDVKFDYKCIHNPDFKLNLEPIEFPYNEYHSNGTIEVTHTFIEKDKIKVETFYATGKKKEIYYIKSNGKKHGLYASWFLNGSRDTLCSYKKDQYSDEYAKWDSDGGLIKYGVYDSGGHFVSRATALAVN